MEAVARCVRKHAGRTPGEGTKARSISTQCKHAAQTWATNADMKKPSRRILRERIQNGRNGRVEAEQLRERTPAYGLPDA